MRTKSLNALLLCFVLCVSVSITISFPTSSAKTGITANGSVQAHQRAPSFCSQAPNGTLGCPTAYQPGVCSYIGIMNITTPHGQVNSRHYDCEPEGSLVSTMGNSSGVGMFLGGNYNDLASWSSGSCNYDCTDSSTDIDTNMKPNTAYWSVQDNAFHNYGFPCYNLMNYQDVAVVGTSSNGYDNEFGVEVFGAAGYFCSQSSPAPLVYKILTGINLNAAVAAIEEWYTLTNGYPSTAWLAVYPNNGYVYSFSSPMPSGNPKVSLNSWELNVVCGFNGCSTTFSGGSGQIQYYQNNINFGNPVAGTGENSNCQYSGPSWTTDVGYQSFSC